MIPCHRVIGSNNSLTGYAGGIEKKEKLLKSRQEKLEEKEAAIDEEILKQREERKALREERGNIQKECDERAAEVVKEVNARNKELAKQVTELVGVKYENEKTMDKIIAVAKARGFVYQGSEIYGGLANTWDYGNLGVELKNNVKKGRK